jgi:hypothetical protein
VTVFALFQQDSDMIGPPEHTWMINFRGSSVALRVWRRVAAWRPAYPLRSINSLNAGSSRIGSKSESSFAYERDCSERSIASPR